MINDWLSLVIFILAFTLRFTISNRAPFDWDQNRTTGSSTIEGICSSWPAARVGGLPGSLLPALSTCEGGLSPAPPAYYRCDSSRIIYLLLHK